MTTFKRASKAPPPHSPVQGNYTHLSDGTPLYTMCGKRVSRKNKLVQNGNSPNCPDCRTRAARGDTDNDLFERVRRDCLLHRQRMAEEIEEFSRKRGMAMASTTVCDLVRRLQSDRDL